MLGPQEVSTLKRAVKGLLLTPMLQETQVTIKDLQEHFIQAQICTNNSQINPTQIKSTPPTNNQIWQWETDNQSNNSSLHQE